jgi:hypothetical protein
VSLLASASLALLFSVLANGGFAGAEVVLPGDRVRVSLGLLDAGTPQDVVIAVRSGLDRQWLMPRTDVTCPACIAVVSAPTVLAAGETADVRLRVTPGAAAGPHRWGVALHGGDEPPLRIDITGIVRGLLASPDRVAFGVCERGTSQERAVAITWHGEGTLASMQVTTEDQTIHATVQAQPREGTAFCKFKLDAGTGRARHLGGVVRITAMIRQPDGSVMPSQIGLPVSGRIEDPLIRFRPGSIFLGSIATGEVIDASVQVVSPLRSGASIRSKMLGLRARLARDGGALHMRYQAAPGAVGVQRGWIRLGFGEPWVEHAQLPVTVYVSRLSAP